MATLVEMGISNAVQVAALAAMVFAVVCLVRNAAVSRCLWLLVLFKLVTPPVLDVPVVLLPRSWNAGDETALRTMAVAAQGRTREFPHDLKEPDPADLTTSEEVADRTASKPLVPENDSLAASRSPRSQDRLMRRILPIVGSCWIAGSLLWFATMVYRCRKFSRLLRLVDPAPQRIQRAAQELAAGLGLRHVPRVLIVEASVSPFVWGAGKRSTVALPRRLIDELDESQELMILAHELAHLARQDRLVRWLECAALGLYWWHPVAWIARSELRNAEELCCDSTAISAFSLSPSEYARTLLKTACFLADRGSSLPHTACGLGEHSSLKRRITMIVKTPLSNRLSPFARVGMLLAAAIVLPLSPFTFAEEDDSPQADGGAFSQSVDAKLPPTVHKIEVTNNAIIFKSDGRAATVSRRKTLFESPNEFVVNNAFDEVKTIGRDVPGKYGGWGGDQSKVVGPEQGIRPRSGDHMLRLLASGAHGPGKGYTACEVFQLIDLSKYQQFIDAGRVTLTASAHVNRVHRSEQTDTSFSLTVYACEGSPEDFHRKIMADETLGEAGSDLHADKNPETWERVHFSFRLPKGATYIGIRVTAGENVSDDATEEFDGHYVDDVSVRIHPRDRSATFVPISNELLNSLYLKSFLKAESRK